MRLRPLTMSTIGRVLGFALVAATIIAAALHIRGPGLSQQAATSAIATVDPLAADLLRCQQLGVAAQSDTSCAQTWAENRRRFFDYTPRIVPPHSSTPEGR